MQGPCSTTNPHTAVRQQSVTVGYEAVMVLRRTDDSVMDRLCSQVAGLQTSSSVVVVMIVPIPD